jgi:hypothetical protein
MYKFILNSVNQLIFVMVKYGVLFEVRTEFLNNVYTSFGFKGLSMPAIFNCPNDLRLLKEFLLM